MNTIKEFAKERLTNYGENLLRQQLTKFTQKYLSKYLAIGFAQIIITLIKENWDTLKNIGQRRQPDKIKTEEITKTLFDKLYNYIPSFGIKKKEQIPDRNTYNKPKPTPTMSNLPQRTWTYKNKS